MAKYKKISNNIQELIIDNPNTKNDKLIWLNISNAGKNEIEYLRKRYNFKLPYLQASSSRIMAQRPDVIKENDYLFIILHFPIMEEITEDIKKDTPNKNIIPAEIEFFVGHGFLITLPTTNIETLNEFFNYCKKDENSLLAYQYESSAILLYEILEKLILSTYSLLDKNSIAIGQAEDIIFAQEQKKATALILALRHNIINIRKIMQSHKNIIKKLERMESSIIPAEKINRYYKSLIDQTKKIWDILENQKEMIEVLNNTNESLINYRLSDIMKTLTIFSVIVFPLTLIAAIFGMNVLDGMPLIHTQNGFYIIISIMLTGSLAMLLFFEKKKWL